MKLLFISIALRTCIGTAAAWGVTHHWRTLVVGNQTDAPTTSIAVYPTGSAKATSTNTSTSLLIKGEYTYPLTIFDLFYPPSAAVCTLQSTGPPCGPSALQTSSTNDAITTSYLAPVLIANPTSCTKTSFAYTVASSIDLPTPWVTDAAAQATKPELAALVATGVYTLRTNLGGQAVVQTICSVYLRSGVVLGVSAKAESTLLTECVDPRDLSCPTPTPDNRPDFGGGRRVVTGPWITCAHVEEPYPPGAHYSTRSGASSRGVSLVSLVVSGLLYGVVAVLR